MARHDLSQGDLSEHVATAVTALKDGYVIVAPLEHGYALMTDAFMHDAVRAMHVLRGDALGVAAQVAIANRDLIDGIARDISADARLLIQNFWPGLLSLTVKPQAGLNWDLGDGNTLDQISVRIPNSQFILEVLKKSGPVAIASAALVGSSAISDSADISYLDTDVAAIFTAGVLPKGGASTVIDLTGIRKRIVREGAISSSEITALLPDISHE
jgi:tRNA threonylcarbamoyl adenosine modification protein (Sua5/YciO/YrdC/YwlC family)